ncbi:uncharacterized protein BDR25DRAFT_361604 [Lindgomyces ingoldianus]|uniref:Uncharacterized protein n=1 Tax=Lindgomyces ingoldianus TaxID=673940 RepID=A0ACB6QC23_9PLEO|nr:uncharacterized protein BDR25DRAFT_361604 [Lindgomyces ingoldianus]KAF2464524.1 hypothetical protein BDR25DRAFT_361604 [Lindgomyces ingoldianus]
MSCIPDPSLAWRHSASKNPFPSNPSGRVGAWRKNRKPQCLRIAMGKDIPDEALAGRGQAGSRDSGRRWGGRQRAGCGVKVGVVGSNNDAYDGIVAAVEHGQTTIRLSNFPALCNLRTRGREHWPELRRDGQRRKRSPATAALPVKRSRPTRTDWTGLPVHNSTHVLIGYASDPTWQPLSGERSHKYASMSAMQNSASEKNFPSLQSPICPHHSPTTSHDSSLTLATNPSPTLHLLPTASANAVLPAMYEVLRFAFQVPSANSNPSSLAPPIKPFADTAHLHSALAPMHDAQTRDIKRSEGFRQKGLVWCSCCYDILHAEGKIGMCCSYEVTVQLCEVAVSTVRSALRPLIPSAPNLFVPKNLRTPAMLSLLPPSHPLPSHSLSPLCANFNIAMPIDTSIPFVHAHALCLPHQYQPHDSRCTHRFRRQKIRIAPRCTTPSNWALLSSPHKSGTHPSTNVTPAQHPTLTSHISHPISALPDHVSPSLPSARGLTRTHAGGKSKYSRSRPSLCTVINLSVLSLSCGCMSADSHPCHLGESRFEAACTYPSFASGLGGLWEAFEGGGLFKKPSEWMLSISLCMLVVSQGVRAPLPYSILLSNPPPFRETSARETKMQDYFEMQAKRFSSFLSNEPAGQDNAYLQTIYMIHMSTVYSYSIREEIPTTTMKPLRTICIQTHLFTLPTFFSQL